LKPKVENRFSSLYAGERGHFSEGNYKDRSEIVELSQAGEAVFCGNGEKGRDQAKKGKRIWLTARDRARVEGGGLYERRSVYELTFSHDKFADGK